MKQPTTWRKQYRCGWLHIWFWDYRRYLRKFGKKKRKLQAIYLFIHLFGQLLVYKVILKPVWTYGIQLWGTALNSNLEILERSQSKVLRIITDAPWYIPNTIITRDLQIPTVKQEVGKCSANYRKRLDAHPNNLANALFTEQLGTHRLKRLYVSRWPRH